MSLSIPAAVLGMADLLRDRIAPTLTDDYAIEANRLATIMLTIMGNAADDAVALRVTENDRVRALLRDGAAIVDDPALGARLEDAAAEVATDLRISALDRESDRLRRLLVALQTWLEAAGGEQARALDRRIWQALRAIEESRAPRV